MHRYVAALTLTALLATACTGPDAGEAPDARTPPNRCSPEMDEGFRAWADAGFNGTVAISTHGRFDCLGGYGEADRDARTPNTTDTVFSIGSISKAFTAAAILTLVDHGKLRLGEHAETVLPGLHGPAARATVRRLLLHTGGLTGNLGGDHAPLDRDAAIRRAGRLRQAYRPGTHYLYSNAGYTLLALIAQQIAGEPYRHYLESTVLRLPGGAVAGGFWDGEPAAPGPRALGYLVGGPSHQRGEFAGPYWALAGNGDLAMTTGDLARWTYALFSGEVVSKRSTRLIARPGFPRGNGRTATPGWVTFAKPVYGEPVVATSGGGGDIGHDAVVARLPDSERVVAIASNTPGVRAEDLLTAVAPALIAGDPVPPPDSSSVAPDPKQLAAAAGAYRLRGPAGGSLDVKAHGDGLAVRADGEDAAEALFPLPTDVSTDDAAAHEGRVLALLRGESDEGRKERELFESDFGDITGIEPGGTLVADGELRTYVTVETATESVLGWYAVDATGAISAAEIPTDPPTLSLVRVGGDRYRPDDPTGEGPDVTVTFHGRRMTLTAPDGTVEARRDPGRRLRDS